MEIRPKHDSASMRALMQSDVCAWARLWSPGSGHLPGLRTTLKLIWNYAGLRASLLYRLSHGLHKRGIKALPQLVSQLNIMLHGLDIPPHVPIGPYLYVPHPVGTVVTARQLGSDVTLVSGVTIGMRNTPVFPTIGNHVFIGAGARVLGDIFVGDHVSIGANAVVLSDVPDHSVAVGVPATVRPTKGPTTSVACLPAARDRHDSTGLTDAIVGAGVHGT